MDEKLIAGSIEYTVTFEKIICKEGFERHRILINDQLWYGKLTFATNEESHAFFEANHPVEFDFSNLNN